MNWNDIDTSALDRRLEELAAEEQQLDILHSINIQLSVLTKKNPTWLDVVGNSIVQLDALYIREKSKLNYELSFIRERFVMHGEEIKKSRKSATAASENHQ